MSFELLMDSYRTNKTLLKNWYLLQKIRTRYKKKILKIYNNLITNQSKTDIQLDIEAYKKKWSPLNKHINPHWYTTFSYASGIEDLNYVPEDLFYGIIEPTLNNLKVAIAYTDKNFYDKFHSDVSIFPETILRNMEWTYYTSNYNYIENIKNVEIYLEDEEKVIVKPSLDTGGGRNVQLFCKNNNGYFNKAGEKLTVDYLKDNYKSNFLIQKYIESADYFKQFNESSLNTMRIYTYRSVKTNDVFISNCLFRIGKKGAEIDNVSLGGICCLIDKRGRLSHYAVDLSGNKFDSLPWDKNFKFSEVKRIPRFKEIKEFVKEVAKSNYYQRLLGLDVCIDNKDNIKLIEINNEEVDINMFQIFGSSIFKEHTEEVIKYCSDPRNRRIRNIKK